MEIELSQNEGKTTKAASSAVIDLVLLRDREKAMLWIMAGLQVLWLIGIGWLGASSDWARLIGISISSVAAALILSQYSANFSSGYSARLRAFLADERRVLVFLLLACLVIGGIYALFQRVWVYDEEQNFRLASIFASQGIAEFFNNYATSSYFANQHPPLVALVSGSVMRVFGVDLLVARLVSLAFCVGIIWLTYRCGRELFDGRTGLMSAALLMTFPLIMRLGSVAMLDIPVTFFFLLSFFLFLSISRKPSLWKALFLGLTIMACFMSRYTGIFIVPVLMICSLITASYRKALPYLFLSFLLAGLLILGWLYFLHGNNLSVPGFSTLLPIGLDLDNSKVKPIMPALVLRAEGAQVWGWAINSLLTRLPSAIGVYNLPIILLGSLLALINRKPSGIVLLLWIVTVTVLLLLTLPDHRYFMPIFPALALLAGIWLRDRSTYSVKILLLAFFLLFGSLVLFVDWQREAQLFTQ